MGRKGATPSCKGVSRGGCHFRGTQRGPASAKVLAGRQDCGESKSEWLFVPPQWLRGQAALQRGSPCPCVLTHSAMLQGNGALPQEHPHTGCLPSLPHRGGWRPGLGRWQQTGGLCAGWRERGRARSCWGVLRGRQGSLSPAAGPGALPDTFLGLPGKRERVWAQGKCTATAAPARCLGHCPMSLGQLGPTVAPARPQHPSPPQAGPPPGSCAASPTLPPCKGALSWELPDTPGHLSLSPPECPCSVTGAVCAQH